MDWTFIRPPSWRALTVLKGGKVQKQMRMFGTTTRELLALRGWRAAFAELYPCSDGKCRSLLDKFFRLKARRGYKRAAVELAHKILVAIYHMFSHRVCYTELGDLYLNKLNKHHLTRDLVHRLERLGYTVTLEQKAA